MKQLRIVHTTGFEYGGKALASYNQARLTPVTTPQQIVLHHRVEISPKPWTYTYRDYFGNEVLAFEVVDPHEALTVTATSTVQVEAAPLPEWATSWEQLARPEVSDRWTEYLMLPELVAPPDDLAARAKEIAAAATLPADAAREICAFVSGEIANAPGSTNASTPATVAWRQRAGVSQDVVHLVLGALRTVGIPARYVSGYAHPVEHPEIGQTVAGDSHAWVEWWDDGWQPFDPTTCVSPGDTYVAVARGRDYTDVRPLAGIYSGAPTSRLFVDVDITRLG